MTPAIPTHATKAGIRYRYYVSRPCLHGETKTTKVGSVTRVPAADIEDVVVKSLDEHLRSQSRMPASTITSHSAIAELVDRIDIHGDRLAIRLRSWETAGTTKPADDIEPTGDGVLSIPWQKPPFKRFREILLPHGLSRHRSGQSGQNDAYGWCADPCQPSKRKRNSPRPWVTGSGAVNGSTNHRMPLPVNHGSARRSLSA